jgi:hypothetical protein
MKLYIIRSLPLNFYLELLEMVLNLRPFTKSLMEKVIQSSSLKANKNLYLAPTIQSSGSLLKKDILLLTLMQYLSQLLKIRFIDSFQTRIKYSRKIKMS